MVPGVACSVKVHGRSVINGTLASSKHSTPSPSQRQVNGSYPLAMSNEVQPTQSTLQFVEDRDVSGVTTVPLTHTVVFDGTVTFVDRVEFVGKVEFILGAWRLG